MRVRRLHGSDFMKGSWCDTDRGRKRGEGMLERVAHDNWTREWMWCDRGRPERRDRWTDEWTGGVGGWVSKGWEGKGGGEGFI